MREASKVMPARQGTLRSTTNKDSFKMASLKGGQRGLNTHYRTDRGFDNCKKRRRNKRRKRENYKNKVVTAVETKEQSPDEGGPGLHNADKQRVREWATVQIKIGLEILQLSESLPGS